MNLRRYLVLGAAVMVAVVAIGLWVIQGQGYMNVATRAPASKPPVGIQADKAVDGGSYNKGGVAPFGMAQRLPKPVEGVSASADAPAAAVMLADQNALFAVHCTACHGRDGLGVEPLGVTLVGSSFINRSSNEELIAMLKVGRMPDSPDSVKGRVMPGFAWMTDEQLTDIAGFLKVQNP